MALLDFLQDLQRLASADQSVRRNELLTILREMDCPFHLFREHLNGDRPENIVVRFQEKALQRLVIGAHYDSVPGSTGANDNGAGVCVLLAWLRAALRHPPAFPVDIVFFDLEELGGIGSRAYIERFSSATFTGMINLDVCGNGDTILVTSHPDGGQSPFTQPLLKARQSGCLYRMVDALPPGDDLSFARAEIPTLSVCILPSDDVEPLIEVVMAMQQRRQPQAMPGIIDTFHNGPRDSIENLEESAMESILHWLSSILRHF